MASLEDRVGKIESLLAEIFRPGGTLAIRDEEREAAAVLIGDVRGEIGSVLMSAGLSVKEPGEETRVVVTSTGIEVKDRNDVLRLLIGEQGILFLDEKGHPLTLIAEDGMHQVGEPGQGSGK